MFFFCFFVVFCHILDSNKNQTASMKETRDIAEAGENASQLIGTASQLWPHPNKTQSSPSMSPICEPISYGKHFVVCVSE